MLTSTNQVNSLIIVIGCKAKLLNLENETSLIGKGISATCDGSFYQDERVVVVGDSDTAIQVIVKTFKCVKSNGKSLIIQWL